MRYVYAGPAVTIPVSAPGLRSRRRFQEDDSEIPSARRIFWRARLWPSSAFPGSMTNLAGSRSKWTRPLGFVTSPRVTGPRAWATRVVVRTMTGVSRDPAVREGHQGVRGDVDPDVLHEHEGLEPADRGGSGDLDGDLLVDRVLERDPGRLREVREDEADLGGRRAGVRGREVGPRLEGPAGDRLVPEEEQGLPRAGLEDPLVRGVHRQASGGPPRIVGLGGPGSRAPRRRGGFQGKAMGSSRTEPSAQGSGPRHVTRDAR